MDKFPDFELSSSRLIVSMEAVTDKDGVMSQMLEMESAARLALANSPIYALHNIDVSSDGEQLLLSGRLPSFYYKQLAQEAVRVVLDDVSFVNDIEVDGSIDE